MKAQILSFKYDNKITILKFPIIWFAPAHDEEEFLKRQKAEKKA
jgi:hypothetical protein